MIDNIFSITKCNNYIEISILGIKIPQRKLVAYIEQLKYIIDSCCDITKCKEATGNLRIIQKVKSKGQI